MAPPAGAQEPSRDPRSRSPEPLQAVILAGGLGTRMLPRTETVPKVLLPVHGRPFVSWLLERIARWGFDEVVLCIGHLGDAIRAAVPEGRVFGMIVRHSDEGDRRAGTAGALRHALPLLAPTFLVTYGDAYLSFDYAAPLRDLRAHPGARGTMAVLRNEDRIEPSNAAIAGELVVRYDKSRAPGGPRLDHIDYGATALRREVIEALPAGAALGLDGLQASLAAAGLLRAHVAEARFFEIGSPEGLADLERELARRSAPTRKIPRGGGP